MSKSTKVQRENIAWFYDQPVDIKFEMVMNHFEMSRIMINQIFEEIIREKTGDRYEHSLSGPKKFYRHGFNASSAESLCVGLVREGIPPLTVREFNTTKISLNLLLPC